jgi:hypothetical protein
MRLFFEILVLLSFILLDLEEEELIITDLFVSFLFLELKVEPLWEYQLLVIDILFAPVAGSSGILLQCE